MMARFPTARLVFIGAGPMLGRCRHLARKLSVDGSVSFRGRAGNAEVAVALAGSDVFAFPSKWEGQPNVLLEALAAGVPCAVSDIPANRAVVEPGVEAECFDPEGAESAAAAISRLLGEPDKARRLRDRATERTWNEHRVEVVTDQYMALYGRLARAGVPDAAAPSLPR